MRTRRFHRLAAAFALASALPLASCTPDVEVRDASATTLDEAMLAIYLSPQTYEWSDKSEGYVLLVDRDGAYRAVPTSGMDVGRLVWNTSGLHFSDEDADYTITESDLTKIPSAKANYQYGMYQVGDTTLGFYNLGLEGESMSEGSYITELVEVHDGAAVKSQREGDLSTLSVCDDEVFALAEATGEFRSDYQGTGPIAGWGQLMLYKVWPGEQSVVSGADVPDVPAVEDAPCHNGTIYYLTPDIPGDAPEEIGAEKAGVRLVGWNVKTGKRSELPLTSEHEESAIKLTADQIAWSQYRPGWVVGERLHWVGADGMFRATDVRTGVTEELFPTQSVADGLDDFRAFLAGDDLYVLDVPGDPHDQLVLTRYGLPDGEREVVTTIDDIGYRDRPELVVREAALAPKLLGNSANS